MMAGDMATDSSKEHFSLFLCLLSIYQNELVCDAYACWNWIWTSLGNKDMCTNFLQYVMQCAPIERRKIFFKLDSTWKIRYDVEKKLALTVNESCRLNVFLQIVQWNEASPWTSRLWWLRAVRVGFILWQISHTCGESVWIFMCLFRVPRFFNQAPQTVHWTRGSSMPICWVFVWSWNPSFVLNTFAHTSHIRWSIRSCTFSICIFSMWSDLKLFQNNFNPIS